jgi:myosin-5
LFLLCFILSFFGCFLSLVGRPLLTGSASSSSSTSIDAFIGVLDIFGFENFENNSFEQLCINYTNETLQQHFNAFVFEYEQSLYREEEIQWSFVSFPDNKETLELLENKQKGVFAICDDQSRFAWSTHLTLVNRFYELYASKDLVSSFGGRFSAGAKEKARNLFVIRHYAGNVCYNSEGFLEKNNDLVSNDMIRLLRSSKSSLLLQLLEFLKVEDSLLPSSSSTAAGDQQKSMKRMASSNTIGHGGGSGNSGGGGASGKPAAQTLGSEFRRQLKDLMTNISLTTPHYIRCIKPNSRNTSNLFEDDLVVSQLRCCGVIEAVRVSRSGYPNRFSYSEFLARYLCLLHSSRNGSYRFSSSALSSSSSFKSTLHLEKDLRKNRLSLDRSSSSLLSFCLILSQQVLSHHLYRCPVNLSEEGGTGGGETSSSISNHHQKKDNSESHSLLLAGIQPGLTMVFLRRNSFDVLEQIRFILQRSLVIHIQSIYRGYRRRSYYSSLRIAALKGQLRIRIFLAKRRLLLLKKIKASILFQKKARRFLSKRKVNRWRRLMILIQSCCRRWKAMKVGRELKKVKSAIIISANYRR